ncbi:MAG: hypothetical protein IT372_05850 [Polyangiaceae bacterium]|nr:hypothetical protein [Polyangiaceae bacterium]
MKMQYSLKIRRSLTVACLALVGLFASGCAPAGRPFTPADDPQIAFEFDAGEGGSHELVRLDDAADINGLPIHVWVEKGSSGDILSIRVTGHATEEVCAKASLALLSFLTDSPDVEGFLSFGVGELRPKRGARGFQAKARSLLAYLQGLSEQNPEYLRITETTPAPPVADSAPPPTGDAGARVAVMRYRRVEHGPAFIPVRTWRAGAPPEPLQFNVRVADLGLGFALVRRMTEDVATGPVVEQLEILRARLRHLDRVLVWKSSGHRFASHDGVGIRWGQREGAPTVADVEKSTDLLDWFVAVEHVSAIMTTLPAKVKREIDITTRRLDSAISVNRRCASALRSGRGCFGYNHAEPIKNASGVDASTFRKLLSLLDEFPVSALSGARAAVAGRIGEHEKMLDHLKRSSPARRRAIALEISIDGLLRGWPIPASDDETSSQIDALEEEAIPAAWNRLLSTIAASGGPELREEGRVAGALQRATVFYRVESLPGDRFRITPYHVVVGPYVEVWDPDRHTVTVETPLSEARDAGQAEEESR